MAQRKRLFPFWCTPQALFLSGTARSIAEIEYYEDDPVQVKLKCLQLTSLTSNDYESQKNQILFENDLITEYEYNSTKLELELKTAKITKELYNINSLVLKKEYHVITEREYDESIIELMNDGKEKKQAALDFALKYREISEMLYEKEKCTLNSEPWSNFDAEFDESSGEIILSFDYNEHFCQLLKEHGYPGDSNEELIDSYTRQWGRKLISDDEHDIIIPVHNEEEIQTKDAVLKMHR